MKHGTMRRSGSLLLAAVAASLALASPASAQWKKETGVLLRGTVATMDEHGTVKRASLLIRNGKIEQILSFTAPVPEGAIEIKANGIIFPGLINLHNHIAYNFLPLFPVPKHYDNRDQWPTGALYEELVNNPKKLVTDPAYFNKQTDALKWAEIKCIVGGETTVQGSPSDQGTATILARNVELKNFGEDKVGQRGLSIDGMFTADLEHNKASIAKLDGWLFHLSEGIDDHARREYYNPGYDATKKPSDKNQAGLKNIGLVTPQLIGIHCTALKEEDFADWKKTTGEGAKIVWSPLSNLLLYGKTTDILAARRQGATVALGSDWSPSGSKSLLWELKVADQVNKQQFGGQLSDEELVAMCTRNPAKLVKWQDRVGMIKVGMYADLMVIDQGPGTVYRDLIQANEQQVKLVFVDGDPIYGDERLMKMLKVYDGKPSYELMKDTPTSRKKALDLKRKGIPEGEKSLDEIKKSLEDALKYDPKALADTWNEGIGNGPDKYKQREAAKKWLAAALAKKGKPVPPELLDPNAKMTPELTALFLKTKFPNAKPLAGVDPIYQQNDKAFFDAVAANLHFVGPSPVFDPNPLRSYVKSSGVTNAIPH